MANTNKRIYYAIQQVRLGSGNATEVHGLQTVGLSTNFNLEQVFEIGQLEIYQNLEEIPEVEATLNKVLDGYPLIYTLATEKEASGIAGSKAVNPTLVGRQNARCDFELSIFPDSELSAKSGTNTIDDPASIVRCPGMYVSSVSYTFPVDGNFTEDVTLVGNDKVWTTKESGVGRFENDDSPKSLTVNRRQHLNMSGCLFPSQIPGVTTSGTLQDFGASGLGWSTHFQNITVSCDLGRETINELGRFGPYHRYVSFPVEVTSEFEILAVAGDGIQASEEGFYKYKSGIPASGHEQALSSDDNCVYKFNLLDQTIYLETCEGTKIHLGDKNKLSSVNYQGGDTGGGNVTVSYSYSTFNDFTVAHKEGSFWGDVTKSGYKATP